MSSIRPLEIIDPCFPYSELMYQSSDHQKGPIYLNLTRRRSTSELDWTNFAVEVWPEGLKLKVSITK